MVIEPWHWLVFGAILIISEIFLTTFASLWFGLAAIIVAALLWFLPLSPLVQVIIWLILSILWVVGWFKFAKPLMQDRTKAGLGSGVIIGEVGMIIVKPTAARLGMVRFTVPIAGSDEWMCRTEGEVVAVGDRVIVTDISGNELVVTRVKKLPFVH